METLLLLGSEVELPGEHGREAGDLFLPDGGLVVTIPDAPHGHLPVDQGQELRELQGISELPHGPTQVLDVPGAVDRLAVGIVAFSHRVTHDEVSASREGVDHPSVHHHLVGLHLAVHHVHGGHWIVMLVPTARL